MADLPRQDITDPAALRFLAHPLRNRIAELMQRGPVSATTLARALGESTGATSYHLRQMAKHGFAEEVPELSRGRERWWRFIPADRRFPPYGEQTPEMRAAMEEMHRLDLADDVDKLTRFQRERGHMGEWADAVLLRRGSVRMTIDELGTLFEEYTALLNRYQRPDDDTPSSARTVLIRFLAFPEPDDALPAEDE
jgi:DNA-binding MarR family transcriptional regulator